MSDIRSTIQKFELSLTFNFSKYPIIFFPKYIPDPGVFGGSDPGPGFHDGRIRIRVFYEDRVRALGFLEGRIRVSSIRIGNHIP